MLRLVVAALALAGAAHGSDQPQAPPPPTASVVYGLEAPVPKTDALRARFTAAQLDILELLNRADVGHLTALPVLVVPAVWHDDPLAYSPFPLNYDHWPEGQPKGLVVDQAFQAFAAYEFGRLVRWGPTNSGRLSSQTPAGLFHLNWRSRGRHSTVNAEWFLPWYFNFHNKRGLSFHQYALPGHPASHACLRLLERDARWLYDWGEVWTLDERGWEVLTHGTPLLILNCHAFGQPAPWRSLDRLRSGVQLPATPDLGVRECDAGP